MQRSRLPRRRAGAYFRRYEQAVAIPTSGKSLDIYKIEGTTLKFGKGSKISVNPVESDRPTVIDDTRVFTKMAK